MPTHNGIPVASYHTITFGKKADDKPKDKPKDKSGWDSVIDGITRLLIPLAIIAVAAAFIVWLQADKKDQAVQDNSPTSIVAQLSQPPPPPLPAVDTYPATLAAVCRLNTEAERSKLYTYPPTGGSRNLYLKDYEGLEWEGIVRLDPNGMVTTADGGMHPAGYPPYFGQCNAAKAAFRAGKQVCDEAANRTLQDAEQFCRFFQIYAFVFSVGLQLEYRVLHLDVHYGNQYVDKLLTERVEFDNGLNPSNSSMNEMFSNMTYGMLSIMAKYYCCQDCDGLNANCNELMFNIGSVGIAGFSQHTKAAFENALNTVEDSNSALQTLYLEDYRYEDTPLRRGIANPVQGSGIYPEYFDLCLASQRMFDYMLQNPYVRYPRGWLAKNMNRMFRCSEPGADILQAQSTILRWEYEVSYEYKNDRSLCPEASEVEAILDKTSLLISRSSEFQYGIVASLIEMQGGEVYQAPPTTGGTMWLPGNDVYVMQWYWINFIQVHVPVIERSCKEKGTIRFRNPFGFGYKQKYRTTDPYILNSYTVMQSWENFDGSLFPLATNYMKYTPTDAYSELLDYNGALISTVNDKSVGPRENEQMAFLYPLNKRYESTTYDNVMQPKFDDVYKDCTKYDPTGYVQQFFALDVPIDRATALSFFRILATELPISYSNFTVDGSTPCTSDVTKCVWKYCDLRFGGILNPSNDYMPYAGEYQTTKTFTISYMAAPYCIEYNHPATMDRCSLS